MGDKIKIIKLIEDTEYKPVVEEKDKDMLGKLEEIKEDDDEDTGD